MERKTISVFELSKTLGISKSLAYSLIRKGTIPSIRLGEKRIVVPISAVENLLTVRDR